jgi:hypothetical protein
LPLSLLLDGPPSLGQLSPPELPLSVQVSPSDPPLDGRSQLDPVVPLELLLDELPSLGQSSPPELPLSVQVSPSDLLPLDGRSQLESVEPLGRFDGQSELESLPLPSVRPQLLSDAPVHVLPSRLQLLSLYQLE